MELHKELRGAVVKWLVGVAGAAVLSVGGWISKDWFQSIVMKQDLESFAVMIGEEMRDEIAPIAAQVQKNTTDLCMGRRTTLRAASRDLRDEIDDMMDEREGPEWTNRDEALYAEWLEDLDAVTEELAGLDCDPARP